MLFIAIKLLKQKTGSYAKINLTKLTIIASKSVDDGRR